MPSCNGIICDVMSGAPDTTLELLHRDWRNMRPWRKARGERSWPSLKKARGREIKKCKKSNAGQGKHHPILLLSFSCVAGSWPLKIPTVVKPACLLGPGNSAAWLSVQFCICAIVLPSPAPVPAPFLCLVGDSLPGTAAITRHSLSKRRVFTGNAHPWC